MTRREDDYQASSGSWLLTFILGGLVGAAVALLVAPKPGRQAREQLKDMAQDAKEKAEDYYDHARSKVSDAVRKGTETLQQRKSKPKSKAPEENDV